MAVLAVVVLGVSSACAQTRFELLHSFSGGTDDGKYPGGSLILNGSTLYGMTALGGSIDQGTIFSIQSDHSGFTLLHSFAGGSDDGRLPPGSLISDGSTLYGMTAVGGSSDAGTIFSIQSDHSGFTLLHSFGSGPDDGAAPQGSLISDGSTLYGMTAVGGSSDAGTIFSIQTDHSGFTLLHSFAGGNDDGSDPQGSLISDGSTLYGMTYQGGPSDHGTIFSIRTDHSGFTLLHSFAGGNDDGGQPQGSLISDGSTLYGMTYQGGPSDHGTIFSIRTDHSGFTLLHSFAGGNSDGVHPHGSLILNGTTLYGMTREGGPSSYGTIFSLGPEEPTPTPTVTPSVTTTPSVTPTPTSSVTPTPSAKPSVTPAPSVTPTPSIKPTATLTASPVPTPSLYPTPEYLVIASGDYDGDGISDIAIFRPDTGLWAVRGLGRTYFGTAGDVPVSGDYDGDGITDVSIFRSSNGLWAVKDISRLYFGSTADIPVPGDYDGDGSCDVAVFGDSSGRWAVRDITRVYFGGLNDRPVPVDFEGSGAASIGIFRPSSGLWAIRGMTRVYFGRSGDRPMAAVYRWFGSSSPFRTEIAIFRPLSGLWAVRGATRYYFGRAGDSPVTGDFDGNSLDDITVFRPQSGLWAVRGLTRAYYGTAGDIPVTR